MSRADFAALRRKMVDEQIVGRGVVDPAVISAMRRVPRHLFVPMEYREAAYGDRPLPLGPQQTISQPFIVAYMLEALELKPGDNVLEVGTGSGYQAALLAEICREVASMDIDHKRIQAARAVLDAQGYANVHLCCGNGFDGWQERAPFDAIIVSACPENIPRELVKQLKLGGRMILPLGVEDQVLVLLRKTESGLESKEIGEVRFVPMLEDS